MDIGQLTEDFDGFITPEGELIPIHDADRVFLALTGASESRDRITEMLWQLSRECNEKGYFEATFDTLEHIHDCHEAAPSGRGRPRVR